METLEQITLVIHYLDGSEQRFAIQPKQDMQANLASRLQKILSSDQFILNLEHKIIVIPVSSIKYLELSPTPPKLPDLAIVAQEIV